MNKKKKGKFYLIFSCVIFVLAIICFIIYPSLYEYQCKTRYFEDFEKKITNDVLKSNILIVERKEKIEAENDTSISYDAGSSGVIFKSDGDTYYALTAYHIVKNSKNSEYIIMPYGAPTYAEYRKSSESYVSLEMYYENFEKADVVFVDENYDLAVISFKSTQQLKTLDINENNPKYMERIAFISNPGGERFVSSYGFITSKDYHMFDSNDGLLPVNTLKHNAYETHGSSGSAVLNEDVKIVGINIGGGTDFVNRFKYGVMVPCELINEFLKENDFYIR